jgi:hypothetical protein
MRRSQYWEAHTEVTLRVWLPEPVRAATQGDALDAASEPMGSVLFDLLTWVEEQAAERGFAIMVVDDGEDHLAVDWAADPYGE